MPKYIIRVPSMFQSKEYAYLEAAIHDAVYTGSRSEAALRFDSMTEAEIFALTHNLGRYKIEPVHDYTERVSACSMTEDFRKAAEEEAGTCITAISPDLLRKIDITPEEWNQQTRPVHEPTEFHKSLGRDIAGETHDLGGES